MDYGDEHQNSACESKRIRTCYICGSDKHLKSRCPQKKQKPDRATTSDHKQTLRGNFTIWQQDYEDRDADASIQECTENEAITTEISSGVPSSISSTSDKSHGDDVYFRIYIWMFAREGKMKTKYI